MHLKVTEFQEKYWILIETAIVLDHVKILTKMYLHKNVKASLCLFKENVNERLNRQ